jgi:VWFA-related protein
MHQVVSFWHPRNGDAELFGRGTGFSKFGVSESSFRNQAFKIMRIEDLMRVAKANGGWNGRTGSLQTLFLLLITLLAPSFARAQANGGQAQPQSQPPANSQSQPQSQSQDIPDAPSTVQPPPPKPELPPPTPEDAARPPQPDQTPTDSGQPAGSSQPPAADTAQPSHPMPPVQTVPPANGPRNQMNPQETLFTIPLSVNLVVLPVMVTDSQGRLVYGLRPTDFTVLENGKKQTLTFFSSDPVQLSVAILLDIGLPDVAVQKINETYSALAGSLSPYDEAAIYTYSSTVSQVCDFTTNNARLTATLNELKLVRGVNNGPQAINDPFSVGPTVNGVPMGSSAPPVQTPPRDAHVLNDAVLRAALDLAKRDHTRRRVILVVSDGRELGSQASYPQVRRVLQSRNIQVKAVVVDSSALPVFRQAEKIHHLFLQGYSDILPKYTHATGGGDPYTKLTRNSIEEAYTSITSDVRNQYTLGYSPKATTGSSAYRSIEVQVDKKVKVIAKDGYYPAASR